RALGGRAGAQEVPTALTNLLADARTFPAWVEPARLDRGGAAFLRAGPPGGLVLGCSSLVHGYCSPAGNKPLVFTGRLEAGARRRLAETARFVQAVTAPGGAHPFAPGWQAAVRVRLMHAGVRRMLLASPRWRLDAWGVPVNAFDSAGTVLLFSLIVLDGLDRLGVVTRPDERADLLHLWRWIGHVMGVPHELLFADEAGARAFWDLLGSTQEPPDEDARRLAHTLLDDALAPPGDGRLARARAHAVRGLGWAVSRRLLAPDLTRALHYPPPDRWDAVVARWYRVNRAVTRLPSERLERGRYLAGVRYWEDAVRTGLAGAPAEFAMPTRLRGA
ncbi:MAG: oxygenase MpaB family protein, partial [Myxococcota bacterium]